MDHELDLLLGTVMDSLAKLNVLVYLQARPRMAESPEVVAAAVQRPPEMIARALSELAEARLIESFPVGTGRIVLYGASDDAHVRELLDLLRARYDQGGENWAHLVRRALRLAEDEDSTRSV